MAVFKYSSFIIFAFLSLAFLYQPTLGSIHKDFDTDTGYLYVDEDSPGENGIVAEETVDDMEIHPRWKRDTSYDWKNIPGNEPAPTSLIKKLKTLSKTSTNLPPSIQEAIATSNFSSVPSSDFRNVDVNILEYIPPRLLSKLNSSAIDNIVGKFLEWDRPNAMGRIMNLAIGKLNPIGLVNKLANQKIHNNEAGAVLLYAVIKNLTGAINGLTERNVDILDKPDLVLLKHIPKELLMSVKDPRAAGKLLQKLYPSGSTPNSIDITGFDEDDKALVYTLLEVQYGKPETWNDNTVGTIVEKYLPFIPVDVLSKLKPQTVKNKFFNFRTALEQTFLVKSIENPLQGKILTDKYLENFTSVNELTMSQMGEFAPFVNPKLLSEKQSQIHIITKSEKWKLPVPLASLRNYFNNYFKDRPLSKLTPTELSSLENEIYRNGPPELVARGMETGALTKYKTEHILVGKYPETKNRSRGLIGNEWNKGLAAQLAIFALRYYGERQNIRDMPSEIYSAFGTRILNLDYHETRAVLEKLKLNPDALTEAQKLYFYKRFLTVEQGDPKELPPEFSYVRSRKRTTNVTLDDIHGLPSDSELRLAYGVGKKITAAEVENSPNLVGTLTPKQINDIDIELIPGVLAAVRKSKDGPGAKALNSLYLKFIKYLRLKSTDNDEEDKKMLKYVTAAEVSKLPASILAYFIDVQHTARLPPDVKVEILIALGGMSVKDRYMIPHKTREEIIRIGLRGLEEMSMMAGNSSSTTGTGPTESHAHTHAKHYGLYELAIIGKSVGDLMPKHIEKLCPLAFEQALDILQGTGGDSGEIKYRACLSQEQKDAWRNQIVGNYGPPKTWDPSKVSSLCCAIPFLNEIDIKQIDKDSIVRCSCISDSAPPSHLTELKVALDKACERKLGSKDRTLEIFQKIKSDRARDVADLEAQIGMSKRYDNNHNSGGGNKTSNHQHHSTNHRLTCFAVRLAGNAAHFDKQTLSTLEPNEMKHCLYELGLVKLSPDKTKVLWDKLVLAYNRTIGLIPPEHLRQANYILTGMNSENEIKNLDFSNYDVVGAFGRNLGFSKRMLSQMAKHFETTWSTSKTNVESYNALDLIPLKNILCGFELADLGRIVPEAFSESLPILRSIEPNCELTKLQKLVNIAEHSSVYGEVKGWTAADVRGVGILLKGLTIHAKDIPPESFLGLTPTVAENLGTELLQSLSPEQLGHFPKYSVQALTSEQLDSLNWAGREAVENTLRGALVTGSGNVLQVGIWNGVVVLIIGTFIWM